MEMRIAQFTLISLCIFYVHAYTEQSILIQQRFNYIKQLEPVVDYCCQHYTSANVKQYLVTHQKDINKRLHNTYVTQVFNDMLQEVNLNSLKKCWQRFKSYQFLEDKIFVLDFITLLFYCMISFDTIGNSATHLLPLLDAYSVSTDSDDILFNHFYYIKRIYYIVQSLQLIYTYYPQLLQTCDYKHNDQGDYVFQDTDIVISEPYVKNVLTKMRLENSCKPLIQFYKNIYSLYTEEYHKVKKEYLFLLYTFYLHAAVEIGFASICKNTHDIKNKSIDEVLLALDILSQDLPLVLEKYEFDATLTWKEWARKHWIFLTCAGVSLVIKIIQNIRSHRLNTEQGKPYELEKPYEL